MCEFAFKTLRSSRVKTATAIAGVVFAVVLINVQGGLYYGLIAKASVLTDNCDADVWVAHRDVENTDFTFEIPERWLGRVRGVSGVAQAEPYIVSKGVASLPDGGYEDCWVIGAEPPAMLGGGWSFVAGTDDDLRTADGISFDVHDAAKLGDPELGDVIEMNGRRARFVAKTEGVLSFSTTPYLFADIDTARRLTRTRDGYCSYLLVRCEPGCDPGELRDRLALLLPDADVHTAAAFGAMSRDYFLQRTGIGVSFGAATLLGVFVGLLMISQNLYGLALDHQSEYATLNAIGVAPRKIIAIVLIQAAAIGTVGVTIGLAFVSVTVATLSTPFAPIEIPVWLFAAGGTTVMTLCLGCSAAPLSRLLKLDPLVVLQG